MQDASPILHQGEQRFGPLGVTSWDRYRKSNTVTLIEELDTDVTAIACHKVRGVTSKVSPAKL
jgi:hypothetical protein